MFVCETGAFLMPFVLLNGILDGFSTVTLREHLNGECLLIITVGNMEFGI